MFAAVSSTFRQADRRWPQPLWAAAAETLQALNGKDAARRVIASSAGTAKAQLWELADTADDHAIALDRESCSVPVGRTR